LPARSISTASESHSDFTEGRQPVRAQGASGADDVGDRVGHAELDRDLHRTIEPNDRRVDPLGRQVFSNEIRVGTGDPLTGQIGGQSRPAGAAYRKVDDPNPSANRWTPGRRTPAPDHGR
jgi:hypothetical protein